MPPRNAIVLRRKEPTQSGLDPQHGEIVAADETAPHTLGNPLGTEIHRSRLVAGAELGKGAALVAKIGIAGIVAVGNRRSGFIRLVESNDVLRILDR